MGICNVSINEVKGRFFIDYSVHYIKVCNIHWSYPLKVRIMEMLLNDKKSKQVHEPTQLFRTQSIRAQTH